MKKLADLVRDVEVQERFWSKVDKNGPVPAHRPELGSCHIWMRSTVKGYGQFKVRGVQMLAHRVAYTLAYGEIPVGKLVCHKCDNPVCCNPDHLFVGTISDNAIDAMHKGRLAVGDRNGSRVHPERRPWGDRNISRLRPELFRGERNGRAKLTEEDVREIRPLLGKLSNVELARRFNVTPTVICNIKKGRSWRHVT